jgi:hypothetical protein
VNYPTHQQCWPWPEIDPLLLALPIPAPYGTFRAIARRYGMAVGTLRDRRRLLREQRTARRLWTALEDVTLETQYTQGASIHALALALERTPTAVQGRIWLLGLRRKGRANV